MNKNLFYGGLGLAAISVFLPWLKIMFITVSGIELTGGMIALGLMILSAILYWKEKINLAYATVIALLTAVLSIIIYMIIQFGGISIDLGMFGSISIFQFVGFGLYLLLIGLVVSTYEAIRELRSSNQTGLIIGAVIIGIIIAAIGILLMGDSTAALPGAPEDLF